MELRIDIERANEIAELFRRAPEITRQELMPTTKEALNLLQGQISERTPKAHGQLAQSIIAQEPEVLADNVIGVVGSPLNYAVPAELGTKPHPVSKEGREALEDWAKTKLGVSAKEARSAAFLIARAISKRGTKGAFMFRDTMRAKEAYIQGLYRAAVERIVARLSNG